MKKKMTLVWLFLLALLVSTASPAGAEALTFTENEQIPIVDSIWNPCANEWVDLEGYLHVMTHATLDENGGLHFREEANPQNVVGEGLTTGAIYQFSGTVSTVENLRWEPEWDHNAQTFTWIDQHRYIAQGSAQNGVMQETFHVTINSNGEVTTIIDDFTMICQ
jgi:hypothetical protein